MARASLPAPPPDLLHPQEVADRLACSRALVYKLVNTGLLSAVPLGTGARAAIRITRESYEDYLARQKAAGEARFGATA
jgi:excisionase family DNA binding protein